VSAVTTGPSGFSWENELEGLPRAERTRILLEAAAVTTTPSERKAFEERLVENSVIIAAQIAARYHLRGVPDDDLEQVAYLALVKAVRRYD
jgi:RNA polymerase sigma-B factor